MLDFVKGYPALFRAGWFVSAGGVALCLFALYAPAPALRDRVDAHRGDWLLGVGVFGSVLLGLALRAVGKFVARLWREYDDRARALKEAKETFEGLGPEERALLRDFASKKRRSQKLPSRDPVVRRLAQQNIILGEFGLASEIVDVAEYRIASDALWEYLLADEKSRRNGAPQR